jgi:formylglycine-generating enzyme required for sulfatase activity
LAVVGIGVGAVGGSMLLKRMQAQPIILSPIIDDSAKRADEARKAADEARKVEEQRAAQQAADEAKVEADRLAAEREAADKAAAAEKAAQEAKAAQDAKRPPAVDRAATEKAAAERAAKAEADKAAAAEKAERLAAEKAAADKAAAEKAAHAAAAKAPAVVPPAPVQEGPCGEGMRLVPAGSFKMGTAADDAMRGFDEKALAAVEVHAYCVDQFEFPNKRGVAPTINIAWADAKRLCEGKGKRMCSEDEWEKACKGPGNARWPYGNVFDANACNTEDEAGEDRVISPSGRFAKCRSGFGVADLSGNASEWTAEKVIKGGSFGRADFAVRCSARQAGGAGGKNAEVGFRCCSDPK